MDVGAVSMPSVSNSACSPGYVCVFHTMNPRSAGYTTSRRALDSGSPPDVAYADSYDFQVTAKWAFDGKLEDITSVIDPIRAKFEPRALSTTFLYNDQAKTRAYYAFPLKQPLLHHRKLSELGLLFLLKF